MNNLFYEQLQEQSDGVDLKKFAIKELEKIKEEIKKIRKSGYFISSDGQSGGYYERKATDYESDVFEIIDNHIKELKGE